MATEFPVEYLTVLDEVIEQESFTTKYNVDGAEFANAKTVMVPEITFDGGTEEYNRFKSEGKSELAYAPYELDYDREKTFYVDAIDDVNEAHLRVLNQVTQFERRYLVPEVDKNFFTHIGKKAKTTGTAALTTTNIKAELRKARTQMVNAGFGRADLYVTADTLGILEDAINREFAGEGVITDMVGAYNIFDIYMVPNERMNGLDFAVIANDPEVIRHVVKRAAHFFFAPGQHTNGDGYLDQLRWVYGDVTRKNKTAGLYAHKTATSKPSSGQGGADQGGTGQGDQTDNQ